MSATRLDGWLGRHYRTFSTWEDFGAACVVPDWPEYDRAEAERFNNAYEEERLR